MFEYGSLLGQTVDIGSADVGVAEVFQMIRSQRVDRDEDYVPRL